MIVLYNSGRVTSFNYHLGSICSIILSVIIYEKAELKQDLSDYRIHHMPSVEKVSSD